MHATCQPITLHQHRGTVIDVTLTTNQPADTFTGLVIQIGTGDPIVRDSITEQPGGFLAQFHIPDTHGIDVGAHVYEIRLPVTPVGQRPLGVGVANVLPEPTPTNGE